MKKLLFVTLLTSFSTFLLASDIVFFGNATDVETGESLYQEIHTLQVSENGEPISELVEYVSADGTLLGKKELFYKTPYAPDYTVEFYNVGRKEIVERGENQIMIDAREKVNLAIPSSPYAIDGGFHYFIQQNFEALERGESIDFDFLSAGRGTFLPLEIKPVQNTGDRLVLSLRLQNFFLSRLVKPIELTYSIENKQLLTYDGLTNMPGADGKLLTATISYVYPSENAVGLLKE